MYMKILNPFIWLLNVMSYFGHLETYRHCDKYDSYDFEKDIKYL